MASKKKKPAELKMTPQTFDKMNLTASGIVGVVETLRNKLNVLDAEIKADMAKLPDSRRTLTRVRARPTQKMSCHFALSHVGWYRTGSRLGLSAAR